MPQWIRHVVWTMWFMKERKRKREMKKFCWPFLCLAQIVSSNGWNVARMSSRGTNQKKKSMQLMGLSVNTCCGFEWPLTVFWSSTSVVLSLSSSSSSSIRFTWCMLPIYWMNELSMYERCVLCVCVSLHSSHALTKYDTYLPICC